MREFVACHKLFKYTYIIHSNIPIHLQLTPLKPSFQTWRLKDGNGPGLRWWAQNLPAGYDEPRHPGLQGQAYFCWVRCFQRLQYTSLSSPYLRSKRSNPMSNKERLNSRWESYIQLQYYFPFPPFPFQTWEG